MPKHLTDLQVAQYHRDGFCSPVEVMSPQEADTLRRRLEAAEARWPGELNPGSRNNAHYVLTCLDEIVHHPAILDAVECLLGPDVLLFGTVLFIKDPGAPHFVSWHQDATYMGLEPHDFVTPWLALSPSNGETGAMRMIPGSHRDGIRPHTDTFGADNILTRGQNIEGTDESLAVTLVLRPGQMSLHHPRTIHSSGPNRGRERRIGVAIQSYVAAHVRQTRGPAWAFPVRGRDPHGHFLPARRPRADMEPEAVAFRGQVNEAWSKVLYEGATQRRAY